MSEYNAISCSNEPVGDFKIAPYSVRDKEILGTHHS